MTYTDGHINLIELLLPPRTREGDGADETAENIINAGLMSYYISNELASRLPSDVVDKFESSVDDAFRWNEFESFVEYLEQRDDFDSSVGSAGVPLSIGFNGEYTVPQKYENLYSNRADLITQSVESGEFDISDLTGEIVDRSEQATMMTFPAGIIKEEFDIAYIDEQIITKGGKWTTPELDYWECSFALLAVAEGLVDIDEIEPYQEPRNYYELMNGAGQEPWLSKLSDSDVLDLAVKMRQVDEYGEVPYRALVAIGELYNLEFTETEDGARVLTLESRKEAERIFEEMV
jgi:hypothetical protein